MYSYEKEKERIFTQEGMKDFIKVRDHVIRVLKTSGVIDMGHAMSVVTGDSWYMMALVDHMVVMGDIYEVKHENCCWAQHRIFVRCGE